MSSNQQWCSIIIISAQLRPFFLEPFWGSAKAVFMDDSNWLTRIFQKKQKNLGADKKFWNVRPKFLDF